MLGQRLDQGTVYAAGVPARAISARLVAASSLVRVVELALLVGEVEVERRRHVCRTAIPISSTFAVGSNSSVIPNSPIAG